MSTMSTNLSTAISGQAIIMRILTIMHNYHILERFLVFPELGAKIRELYNSYTTDSDNTEE